MEKEFIPYEESLALKELGFDLDCFTYYTSDGELQTILLHPEVSFDLECLGKAILAPLYQQAFRWFEEKHNIFVERRILTSVNEIMDKTYFLKSWRFPPIEITFEDPYDAFDREKAEVACLRKLIEVTK